MWKMIEVPHTQHLDRVAYVPAVSQTYCSIQVSFHRQFHRQMSQSIPARICTQTSSCQVPTTIQSDSLHFPASNGEHGTGVATKMGDFSVSPIRSSTVDFLHVVTVDFRVWNTSHGARDSLGVETLHLRGAYAKYWSFTAL